MGIKAEDSLPFFDEYMSDARLNLGAIDGAIVRLREDMAGKGHLERIERALHEIKGSAGVMGFHDVEAVSGALHKFLKGICKGDAAVTVPMLELLAEGIELIRSLVKGHGDGAVVDWAVPLRELRSRMEAMCRDGT